MASYRFSRDAETDLFNIGSYTLETWGAKQADRYLSELDDCAARLARRPVLGRACEWLRQGLRRMEMGKHVFFYMEEPGGILICRILHQSMLPAKHNMSDDAARI